MVTGNQLSIGTLKQPEYTGENRCIPCTVVNGGIALAAATGVAIAVPFGLPVSLVVGVLTFVIFAAIIYLRGYLVPGTPHLTKTYLPDSILRHFDHHPASQVTWASDGIDLETTLQDADIVHECIDTDDICLTGTFQQAWTDRIDELRKENPAHEDVASFLTINPDSLSFEEYGDAVVANLNGTELAQWESYAAFLADMAVIPELRARISDWDDLDVPQQSTIIAGLRIFLERCPSCDGPLVGGTERVKSCCRSFEVITMSCEDCGARLFEAEHAG